MTITELNEYLKKNDVDISTLKIKLSRDDNTIGIISFIDALNQDPLMELEDYDLSKFDKFKNTGYNKSDKNTSSKEEKVSEKHIIGSAGTMSATDTPYDLSTSEGRAKSRKSTADKIDLAKYPGFATWNRDLGIIGGSLAAGSGAAFGAAYFAPYLPLLLNVAGLALTPSTWVGGISQAAGYTTPSWLLNGVDLAASAYFANEAGKTIDREGLNLETGLNAILSLAPLTRNNEAINAVSNTFKHPIKATKSIFDDIKIARNGLLNSFSSPTARLGREFNNAVKNTEFINVPIEHVSTNGITEGPGLRSYSSSDVGFHFSPVGSPTTLFIQQSTNAPFTRIGTFTYTNNTKPIFVIDKGNWTYKYNPEIYKGVNPGTTPIENAIALNSKAPNYTYVNNYEGNGALSYMTVEPSLVVLSKNESARLVTPIKTNALISSPYESYLTGITFSPNKQYVGGFIGDDLIDIKGNNLSIFTADGNFIRKSFENQNDLLKYLSEYHQNYVDNLDPITRLLYLNSKIAPIGKDNNGNRLYITNTEYLQAIKLATLDDIDLFYGSDEYRDRFISLMSDFYKNKGYSSYDYFAENDYNRFLNSLNRVLSGYIPVITRDKSAYGFSNSTTNVLGLSTYYPVNIPNTITHEFGHLTYSDFLNTKGSPISVWTANDLLFENPRFKFLPEALANMPLKLLDYYSDTNELRQLLIPAVKEMFENGWSPELAYNKANLGDLKEYFPKDYLIKILGGLLSTFPIITNDKNS